MAAPWATASSGEAEASGVFPVKRRSMSETIGIRVEPPTSSTRSTLAHVIPASRTTCAAVDSVR